MTPEHLSYSQCLLLQRLYDAQATAEERSQAEELLRQSAAARVAFAALAELSLATRQAMELAMEAFRPMGAEELAQAAFAAQALSAASLEELAPLLERFHDGEVDHCEHASVTGLMEEREDVADYLDSLAMLREGILVAGEQLGEQEGRSWEAFWQELEGRMESPGTPAATAQASQALPAYVREQHQPLLQRYTDHEVTPEERALVEEWKEAGQREVLQTLQTLAELRMATQGALERAQEKVDLDGLWAAIEARLDAQESGPSQTPAPVVSLQEARAQREQAHFPGAAAASRSSRGPSRQSLYAAAAAVCLMVLGALLGRQLLGPEQVIIREKTVVIVDSVEYAPGASVMINSPMQPASFDVMPEPVRQDGQSGDADQEPTVIWLFEDQPADASHPKEPAPKPGPI